MRRVVENRLIIAQLVVLAVGFSLYHLFLDYNYCLSADDFSGIDYATDGIPGLSYAWRFYFGWEGPFLSMIVQGLFMRAVAIGVPPFVVLFSVKLVLLFSSLTLITSISNRFCLAWNLDQRLFLSLVFQVTLYLISPNRSEIWHWLIGTAYLTPLIFLQLGAALLIQGRVIASMVPLAFVMQSRATYSLIVFGFIALLCLASIILKWKNRRKWLLLGAGLCAFLLIYLVAPGNYVRMSEHGNSVSFMASQFKVGLHNLLVSYNLAKTDRILLALLAAYPVLSGAERDLKPEKIWVWFVPIVVYMGFAVVHELIFVIVTGYCEWTRVLSLHSFLFLAMALVYGLWFCSFISVRTRALVVPFSVLGVVGLCLRLFTGFGAELSSAEQLKSNYDRRLNTIFSHKGQDTLFVEPLSYNGVLYFEDFSEDPDNWINKDFRKAYGLEFKVALKKDGTAE
ncbi:MAG: hypothetical protein GC178_06370 [Flavobacteriales bacterium]|nr:hypothetical protein [Flavobacteriales bacterium]